MLNARNYDPNGIMTYVILLCRNVKPVVQVRSDVVNTYYKYIYKECARVTITDVVIIKFYLRTSNVVYYVTWMDYALCILSAYIIDIYIDV